MPANGNGALKRDRATSVTLIIICQSFQSLAVGGIALLLPSIRKDLGLSFTQAGSLAAATGFVYALMQIPSGYLADRFRPKRLFIIGVIGSVALAFTFALVTAYWQAVLNQTLSGFFRALLFAPGLALVTAWFPTERRATAMGLFLIGGYTGNVFFNLVGPLLAEWFDWRFAFMSVSSLGIIAALALARFGKEAPARPTPKKVSLRETMQLFRLKFMWLCGGVQYIRLAVIQGVTFWLPSLLVSEKGLPLQMVGLIVALQAILTAPSNLLGGYVSDRLKNPILVIGGSLGVLTITTSLIVTVNSLYLLVPVIAINAMFLQMYFGPLFALPVDIIGPAKAGVSSGFGNLFANLGGLTFAYLLGALRDATGSFHPGFYTMSAACVVGLLLTLALARMRRQALAPAATP